MDANLRPARRRTAYNHFVTETKVVDVAIEALARLIRECRWSARQVAEAAGRDGIVVSEDTVMRVLKRERKPSFEFGMWLVGQTSTEAVPATRTASALARPAVTQLDHVLQDLMDDPRMAPQRSAGPSAQSILMQIKHERERAETPPNDELKALLTQVLEQLRSSDGSHLPHSAQDGSAGQEDPAAAREKVIRRIEEQLIKDVDAAAATKLELAELKKYKVASVASRPKGQGRDGASRDAENSAWQDDLRQEIRSLAHAALAHAQSEDIAGLRRTVRALIDCAPYCKGEVLEADYELRLCQLIFVLLEYRFQEGSFGKVYMHFASAQELLVQVRRGPLGQELVDYSQLRSDLVAWIAETKWRDTTAARDILLSPEEISKLWKINEHRLRPMARSVSGQARVNWEMRLGLAGVGVLRLALRYVNRADFLDLLYFFNSQSGLALSADVVSAEGESATEHNESHHRLLRTEWQIGKLFTLDCLLRECPGVLSRAELDSLHQRRLQLSAGLPFDPASYQRGIDLEYRWILANMARSSLHVAE